MKTEQALGRMERERGRGRSELLYGCRKQVRGTEVRDVVMESDDDCLIC